MDIGAIIIPIIITVLFLYSLHKHNKKYINKRKHDIIIERLNKELEENKKD